MLLKITISNLYKKEIYLFLLKSQIFKKDLFIFEPSSVA